MFSYALMRDDMSSRSEDDRAEYGNHDHWAILTTEDGLVIDVDWGYHSEQEARYSMPHPFYLKK